MAEIIKGTNIVDPIVPYTTEDNIPTHYAKYGKGGFRTVENIEERDNIPLERREDGMLVYVITDENNVHTYQWFPLENNPEGEWKRSKMGGGDSIPLYDSAKLKELGDAAESDYIFIPSENEEGEITENTYTTTKNGSYVDVLFSAIRQLQSEVARLRNAFNYGIYSYSGTDTAMSRVQGVYEGDVEEEPLWAIDEDGLSLQKDLISNITTENEFNPQSGINHTTEGLPKFTEDVTWSDDNQDTIKGVEDSKLFLYLTSNGSNILVNLKDKDDENSEELSLNFNSILENASLDWYNILVVISRKQKIEKKDSDPTFLGVNFIWISVSNPKTDNTIAEGYLDLNNQNLVKSIIHRDARFTISSIVFGEGLQISKAIVYSKYQDFSQEVVPSKPTDSNFSYKAAHITIRSVSTYSILSSIKNQLPENELIFVEDTKKLYIKNNSNLVAISGAGNETEPPSGDNTMTPEEILQALYEKGIINYDPETNKYTGLQPLEGITLVNEDTGKEFEINVDAYGKLIVNEVTDEVTLEDRLDKLSNFPPLEDDLTNWRGFVGQLRTKEEEVSSENLIKNVKLLSDRVKIGSFYAPARTQLTFGCSHGFIELENTSDEDFPLDGCYLHYARKVENNFYTSHLALSGKVPAGGTYLVRCKQYSDLNDPNTFIKVENYDIEWYDKDVTVLNSSGSSIDDYNASGELIDLSHNGIINSDPHGLALTYGKTFGTTTINNETRPAPFTYKCRVWMNSDTKVNELGIEKSKAPYLYWPKLIDAVYYNGMFIDSGTSTYWSTKNIRMASVDSNNIFIDAIYKNTFELDPAQQAYQSFNKYDSSRTRNQSTDDYQYVLLNNEYISFPKTEETYPVSKFTPKASFEKKNVLTDKNKLNLDKPNCVTCSFGINPYTTRTFNWVSSGYFDEYVWVREKNSTEWDRFESYTKKEEGASVDQDSNYPRRREFNTEINNTIYSRIYGYFPGDKNCTYTSHKCILDIVSTAVISKTTYEYVVGRSLANGQPDPEHTSDIMTFTLYPENYALRIYQTTDQQGFHWVEYQVWGAAANYINNKITEECENENIIPVLINTGDMTQSGSRVNEWIDYYNAGKCLFNHLEQVNCVGNNDLCGTVVTELGTGDDIGKSNSFYFHVFYCYEVEETDIENHTYAPIINGKYIPSLYYIDFKDFRIVMVNSEITYENCKSWYRMVIDNNNNELLGINNSLFNEENRKNLNDGISAGRYSVVNIYTGWTVESDPKYIDNFTSIYTILYYIFTGKGENRECIAACHEMPFTVITKDNLLKTTLGNSRSDSDSSLVGSHLNQLNTNDNVAIYWFSRLLEHAGVRLCIGGHKHTYSQTWPVREHYYYKSGNNWISSSTGPMTMTEDLSNEKDNVKWILNYSDGYTFTDPAGNEFPDDTNNRKVHLSKFPIIEETVTEIPSSNYFSPGLVGSETNKGVVYFMCQATGFKLMSNKELPAPEQIFSRFLPKSNTSSASVEQRRPMYAVIDLRKTENNYNISGKLIRLNNIQFESIVGSELTPKLFNQLVHGTEPITAQYLYDNSSNATENEWKYGGWRSDSYDIIDITI